MRGRARGRIVTTPPARRGSARPTDVTKEERRRVTTVTSCRRQRGVTRVPPVSGCSPSAVGGGVRGPRLGRKGEMGRLVGSGPRWEVKVF
jgi:hypothetical protein